MDILAEASHSARDGQRRCGYEGQKDAAIAMITVMLALIGGWAISAQDKYTLESAEWARVL